MAMRYVSQYTYKLQVVYIQFKGVHFMNISPVSFAAQIMFSNEICLKLESGVLMWYSGGYLFKTKIMLDNFVLIAIFMV